jgi:signal transduction histidine kinase
LSERQLSAEDQVRFIGNIVTESKRLERMVAGILELSRTEQGRAAATGEVVDLLSVARSVLDATQPLLQRKALRVVGLEKRPERSSWVMTIACTGSSSDC